MTPASSPAAGPPAAAIRFRSVPFGTRFQPADGLRTRSPLFPSAAGDAEGERRLFANEIVVDVGGQCRGSAGCAARIYDHHFIRDWRADAGLGRTGQGELRPNFGSAALVVLAHAREIGQWARESAAGIRWIVTHREPDFDACCASHLVHRLVAQPDLADRFPAPGRKDAGSRTGGSEREQISDLWWPYLDWESGHVPAFGGRDPDGVAAGLFRLAVYAAWVDQCRPDVVPREASLRFLFQAAQRRGSVTGPDAGAFFVGARLNAELRTDDRDFPHLARQVGESLWRCLSAERGGLPPDFAERHLVLGSGWVAVWSRRGMAVAAKDGRGMEEHREQVEKLAEILASIDRHLGEKGATEAADIEGRTKIIEQRLSESRATVERLVALERAGRGGDGRALRRLLEAMGVSDLARQVDALNNLYRDDLEKMRDEQEKQRDNLLTNVLAIGSALGLGLAVIGADGTGPFRERPGPSWLAAGGLVVTFLLIYFLAYLRLSSARGPGKKRRGDP